MKSKTCGERFLSWLGRSIWGGKSITSRRTSKSWALTRQSIIWDIKSKVSRRWGAKSKIWDGKSKSST